MFICTYLISNVNYLLRLTHYDIFVGSTALNLFSCEKGWLTVRLVFLNSGRGCPFGGVGITSICLIFSKIKVDITPDALFLGNSRN